MIDRIRVLLNALSAGLSSAGIVLSIDLFDPRRGWMTGSPVGSAPEGFADEDFVVVLPGREIAVGRDGEDPDAVALVEAVCDWVMDETGHGWPELMDDNASFVAVLRPTVKAGELLWEGGGSSVPIGQLASVRVVHPSSS